MKKVMEEIMEEVSHQERVAMRAWANREKTEGLQENEVFVNAQYMEGLSIWMFKTSSRRALFTWKKENSTPVLEKRVEIQKRLNVLIIARPVRYNNPFPRQTICTLDLKHQVSTTATIEYVGTNGILLHHRPGNSFLTLDISGWKETRIEKGIHDDSGMIFVAPLNSSREPIRL